MSSRFPWEEPKDPHKDDPLFNPKPEDFQKNNKPNGMRVDVWNGDQSEYLGKGILVGHVAVYFMVNASEFPPTQIKTMHNPELEPPAHLVPDGWKVIKRDDNPKIILDNGETVYGCQVWWGPEKPQVPIPN